MPCGTSESAELVLTRWGGWPTIAGFEPSVRQRKVTPLPVIAVLAAALTAAPWPGGDVTGRDREIVARLTRGGIQRPDSDAGHGLDDAPEHALAAHPAAYPVVAALVAAAMAPYTFVLTSVTVVAPPGATRLAVRPLDVASRPAPAPRRARARAPPLA